MKLGENATFCSCLLKNLKEHQTAADDEGCCVYCGYYVINREVTPKDIREAEKFKEELKAKKLQAIDVLAKEKRHGESIN